MPGAKSKAKTKTKSAAPVSKTRSTKSKASQSWSFAKALGWLVALVIVIGGVQYFVNASHASTPAKMYISNSGSDSWDGSPAHPFRTISRAVDAIINYGNGAYGEITVLGPNYTIKTGGEGTISIPYYSNIAIASPATVKTLTKVQGGSLHFDVGGMFTISRLSFETNLTSLNLTTPRTTTPKIKLANNEFYMLPTNGGEKIGLNSTGSVDMRGNKFYFMDYLNAIGHYEAVFAAGVGGQYYVSGNGFMFPPNFKSTKSKGQLIGMELQSNGKGTYYHLYSVVKNVITNAPGGGGQKDDPKKQIGFMAAKRDTGDLEKDNAFPGFQGVKVQWIGAK